MIKRLILLTVGVLIFSSSTSSAQEVPFAKEDRDRLRNVELKIERLEAKVDEGLKAVNQRIDGLERSVNQRIDGLERSVNQRIDDLNNSVNRRFDDLVKYFQILTGVIIAAFGGIVGWLVVIWRKLIKVEVRQSQFETQDDEIKFLKEAYNRVNEMVVKLMELLKPPKGAL